MKSQIETWKWIEGYEGLYKVSDCGAVKSMDYNHTGKEKVLNGAKEKDGYLQVVLWKNGVRKHFKIHRLVAETFIPNPDNLPQVNHKDEVKTNNHLGNLEWCTPEYNINYGSCIERRTKKTSKPVKQSTLDGLLLKEWASVREVKRVMGFSQSSISDCCNGKQKTAYGYKWSF